MYSCSSQGDLYTYQLECIILLDKIFQWLSLVLWIESKFRTAYRALSGCYNIPLRPHPSPFPRHLPLNHYIHNVSQLRKLSSPLTSLLQPFILSSHSSSLSPFLFPFKKKCLLLTQWNTESVATDETNDVGEKYVISKITPRMLLIFRPIHCCWLKSDWWLVSWPLWLDWCSCIHFRLLHDYLLCMYFFSPLK